MTLHALLGDRKVEQSLGEKRKPEPTNSGEPRRPKALRYYPSRVLTMNLGSNWQILVFAASKRILSNPRENDAHIVSFLLNFCSTHCRVNKFKLDRDSSHQ
ncbi:hypothetical protein BT93_B2806 [Corymbia citriodora subsp. variegata]|nr:hypothetical protein BT93_B2806 [Corymbia citriodora subsp. variegata]